MRKSAFIVRSFQSAAVVLLLTQVMARPVQENDEAERVFTNARRLHIQRNHEEAIREFKKAAKLRGDQCGECFYFIGRIHHEMRQYKEAAAAYKLAVSQNASDQIELHNLLGVALYLQGDKKLLSEAEGAFRRSIELSEGKHPTAYLNLGHTLIKAGKEAEGVEAMKEYLKRNPSGPNAAQARAIIANPRVAGENFAPTFRVTSTRGEELSLESLQGKVVLLDFWAVWCGPCRAEMPAVKKMWDKYRGDKFIIVGVSLDKSRGTLDDYVRKEDISWPQYYDERGKISQLYAVRAIPHTVLIDHDGIIRAVGLRGPALSSKVGELIKKLPDASGDGR